MKSPFGKSWKYVGNSTKPGDPKWNEYEEVDGQGNPTGRRTMQVHTPKLVADFNCDHYFDQLDSANAQCRKCTLGQRLGATQIVRDGKIVRL